MTEKFVEHCQLQLGTGRLTHGAVPPTDRSSSMLPKPKVWVANETDGVGWTDLFHGFVSVEARRPSLKCIRALSVPRRSVEVGIQSWFGFECRLEPMGFFDKLPQYCNGVRMCLCPNVKLKFLGQYRSPWNTTVPGLNVELASVGRFETWPHADSETSSSSLSFFSETLLEALQDEARLGWVCVKFARTCKWMDIIIQARSGPRPEPRASSVANPWTEIFSLTRAMAGLLSTLVTMRKAADMLCPTGDAATRAISSQCGTSELYYGRSVQPIHRCDGRIRTKVLRVINLSAKCSKGSGGLEPHLAPKRMKTTRGQTRPPQWRIAAIGHQYRATLSTNSTLLGAVKCYTRSGLSKFASATKKILGNFPQWGVTERKLNSTDSLE
ncbi:hypothetical protein B0H14DRAFT_3146035 [Mycena olivaceomarginata]|nr:hypothetical protein B0H14DRAFT_3146035 [Mycena olivaceomarginata]